MSARAIYMYALCLIGTFQYIGPHQALGQTISFFFLLFFLSSWSRTHGAITRTQSYFRMPYNWGAWYSCVPRNPEHCTRWTAVFRMEFFPEYGFVYKVSETFSPHTALHIQPCIISFSCFRGVDRIGYSVEIIRNLTVNFRYTHLFMKGCELYFEPFGGFVVKDLRLVGIYIT